VNRTDRLYALVEELRSSAPRARTARQLPAGPTVGLLADPQGHVVGLVQG
jgi:hypothetical protein